MFFRLVALLTLAVWLGLNVIACAGDDDLNASRAPTIAVTDNQESADDVNRYRLLSFAALPAAWYFTFPQFLVVRSIEKAPGSVVIRRRPFEMKCSFLL
jgi:hypothetical protein